MKLMLRIAVIAASLSVFALPAVRAADDTSSGTGGGQPPVGQTTRPEWRRPRMSPAERLSHLSKVLNLTGDQKAKIELILKDEQEKRRAIMSDSSLSREDRRTQMMDLMKSSQAMIRALLTPEQQQKFDTMPRPGRGPMDRGAAAGPPPGEGQAPGGNSPPPGENSPPPGTP